MSSQTNKLSSGFTFEEICAFENTVIEVHSLCREKFEETGIERYEEVAVDCLKTINDMEKLKARLSPVG